MAFDDLTTQINLEQAVETSAAESAVQQVQDEQNLHFVERTDEMKYDMPDRGNALSQDEINAASLGDFLSRPVKLRSVVVTEGAFSNFTINPWYDFFNNSNIKKKLDNFAFIQADLHIKIIVNASPFLYGTHLVSYRPLPAFHTIPDPNINSIGAWPMSIIANSQCPHVWVFPQTSTAGEIICPWFYYKNWLDVTSAADLQAMGTLNFQELIPLRSANAAATYRITYQVYAWATNVKLTGATTKLSVQSGKAAKASGEWSDAPISSTATAVANMARAASNIPYFAPFAKVTEIGATAISKIASLFGYSNPPVIDNVQPLKNEPFHAISCPNFREPTGILTLDPKCELSVDPSTVDLTPTDEMDIKQLCERESLLTYFVWKSTDNADTFLFSSNITPMVCQSANVPTAVSTNTGFIYAPMGHVSRLFTFWRGDIIFRFKSVSTQYHKGRLIISWDPLFRVATTTDIYTTSFTQVVDLTPEMDVSIRIPYLQARHYLTLNKDNSKLWSSKWINYTEPLQGTSTETGTGTFNNGQIVVKVQNELSGPTDLASIGIMVFVRAADNFELTNPESPATNLTSAVYPQGPVSTTEETNVIVAGKPGSYIPESNLMYIGESVKSLRTLYRRQILERIIPIGTLAVNTARNHSTVSFRFTKWPKSPGYVLDAPSQASSSRFAATNLPFSWSNHSAITWMQPCFVAMRGSIRRSFNVTTRAENLFSTIQIVRKNATAGTELTSFAHSAFSTSYGNASKAFIAGSINAGLEGMTLANQVTQTGISVECPHYYPYKFCGTQTTNYQGVAVDETLYRSYAMNMVINPAKDSASLSSTIECYVGAGTDFTMFFFISTPILWTVADPTPV